MNIKNIISLSFILASSVIYADSAILHIENDTLLSHKDNNYSHGTEFEYVYQDWHFKA